MLYRDLIIAISILLCAVAALPVAAQENEVFFREDFNDLENWKPLYFPSIKEHSRYRIETAGEETFLKAESNASASGIVFKKEFNVFEYPRVKWRWKISNVYKKGNAEEKSGDDYPVRIYIMFKYDPEEASFSQRVRYGLAKAIYGEYPPHSSLNYIWESRNHDKSILTSAYAAEVKLIILQTGDKNAGEWVEQEVNIINDYRMAFGGDPPALTSIAIMNDSDNTGESSESYIDYIEVFR